MKKYCNKKGSSLIMVLGAMLILTAVGVLVITMSSANIRMSAKYNAWSEEYYDLDYAAQERLIQFDEKTLVAAEKMARYYLQNNYFAYENATDFPTGSDMATTLRESLADSELQTILHQAQLDAAAKFKEPEKTPAPEGEGGGEETPSAELSDAAQEAYNEAMKELAVQAFDLLYYFRADQLMALTLPDPAAEPEEPPVSITTYCMLETENWFPAPIGSLSGALAIIDANMPQVSVTAREPDQGPEAEKPKQVRVLITLKSPGYELSPQTRYVPLKINPLYTNAISAGGSITFLGDTTVVGDVVSGSGGLNTPTQEGENSGVMSRGGAEVIVRGNLYSANDIHIFGNGGDIKVEKYPSGYENTLKQELYDNEYYLEGAVLARLNGLSVKEGDGGSTVPFLYKDNGGGNAYCNSFALEDGVSHADLSVAGSLWTQDDVQNDGGLNAVITVGGNYIGLRSDALGGDPNGSSAVINNGVREGAQIKLLGDYIIPGTAFYVFSGPRYYQTAESGSANTLESFVAYFAEQGDSGTTYSAGSESYKLFDGSLAEKIARIESVYKTYTDATSGIELLAKPEYYALGVVVDSAGKVRFDKTVKYQANQSAYYAAKDDLVAILASKTHTFGTAARSMDTLINGSFGVLDNANGFYWLGDGTSITLGAGGIQSGIIYCDGDLSVNGSGTFKGSIICKGNLTVAQSGLSIVHDEAAILAVLGVEEGTALIQPGAGSRIARRFFTPLTPLTMGKDLATEIVDTVSVNVGERTSTAVDRYTVNAWRESRVKLIGPT